MARRRLVAAGVALHPVASRADTPPTAAAIMDGVENRNQGHDLLANVTLEITLPQEIYDRVKRLEQFRNYCKLVRMLETMPSHSLV